jgi:hypothetical protein
VKDGRHEGHHVRYPTASGQDRGHLDRMVDVGRGADILAPLRTVLASRELQCGQELGGFGDTSSTDRVA